jgi:hypothetical protein
MAFVYVATSLVDVLQEDPLNYIHKTPMSHTSISFLLENRRPFWGMVCTVVGVLVVWPDLMCSLGHAVAGFGILEVLGYLL